MQMTLLIIITTCAALVIFSCILLWKAMREPPKPKPWENAINDPESFLKPRDDGSRKKAEWERAGRIAERLRAENSAATRQAVSEAGTAQCETETATKDILPPPVSSSRKDESGMRYLKKRKGRK